MLPAWYIRIFLREDGYFGRGGFTECMITLASGLYAAALVGSPYGGLPTTVDTLIWKGIPVWSLALPAMCFALLSAGGILLIGRSTYSRTLRVYGMLGQIACFFAALALSFYESGFHFSVVGALEIPYFVASTRTVILIRFRNWP